MSVVDTGSVQLPWAVRPTFRGPMQRTAGGGDTTGEVAADRVASGEVPADHAALGGSAFADFVATRGAGLVRLARGLLQDPHQAEDVVQDVLAKTLVQWGRISAAADVDAYVRRMVVNACTSWFRRAVRRERAHDTSTMPDRVVSWDLAIAVTDRDRVVGLLRRLPSRQRTVLVLRHYEGIPDAEIARLLGTSEVTVRSNVHRGLVSLRRIMAEDDAADAGRGR
jgi:RNA polymerase sigma-70 factor (sigma-E family)